MPFLSTAQSALLSDVGLVTFVVARASVTCSFSTYILNFLKIGLDSAVFLFESPSLNSARMVKAARALALPTDDARCFDQLI